MKFKFITILLLSASTLVAQTDYSSLSISNLTMQDGLLTDYVNVIYQDSKGFIWIGTNEGLNRFDGLNFVEFSNHPYDSLSVSSNVITEILEDSNGELWVGSTRGLNRMSADERGFIKYTSIVHDRSRFGGEYISEIFEDHNNHLWVGTGDGNLHLYDPELDQFDHFIIEGKAQLNEIIDGPDETLILGFGSWVLPEGKGGIMLFDKKTRSFIDVSEEDSKNLSVTNVVHKEKDNYWVSTYNSGLYEYSFQSGTINKFKRNSNPDDLEVPDILFGIFKDKQGVLWINTDGWDIMWYDWKEDRLSSLSGLSPLAGTSDWAITSSFEDSNGIFWVGTGNHGILVLDKYKSRFQHLSKGNDVIDISGKSVLALEQSKDGGIWVGFDHGGLNYINLETQVFKEYPYNSGASNTLSDDVINGLYETKSGDLYIGTYLNGFDVLNKAGTKFTHFGGKTALYNASYIKCFYEDKSKNIWIGTRRQGLIKYNPKDQSSINFKPDPSDIQSLNHEHVSAILEENENSLWIGTFNGLNQIDINSGRIKSWKHEVDDPNSISGIEIYALCKDQRGGLWIGTDNGLNYYDRLNDNFKHFTTRDGLFSNTIKGILADDHNNLWISTNRGISMLSLTDQKIRSFGKEDGLIGLEYEQNAALKTSDGKMLFGSTNGLSIFHPDEITINSKIPPVIITNLVISNQPVEISTGSILNRPISETTSITLKPEHTVFSFEFVALNYTSPQKNQYAYMLEGFDNDWIFVNSNNRATYTNIGAGKYNFKVKASNNDGLWNEQGASIEVVILPVWWKTWWAYMIYFLVFMAAVLGAKKATVSRLKLLNDLKLERIAKEKEHEVNQIKIKFFTNLSHEFRTPLTLILGPLDKMIDYVSGDVKLQNQLKLVQRNARRLFRLINQLMDFRKVEQGQMEIQTSEVDIVSFVKKLVENFNLLAEEKGIQLSFNTSLTYQNLWIDQEMIDKVVYNLLANAFNFTDQGGAIMVTIEFAASVEQSQNVIPNSNREYVAITVTDTGKGISKENIKLIFNRFYQAENVGYGTGIGLSLAKSLVELHNGHITVDSTPGKGSSFIVLLPLGKSHLDAEPASVDSDVRENIQEYLEPITEPESSPNGLPVNLNIEQKGDGYSLLIVDDNSELRYFLKESLSDNFSILEATNGKEALDILSETTVDLIISDVMMPEMDGLELCKQLKTRIETSHIPLILLTAKYGEDNTVKGLQTGADAYITKPFSLKLLQARIENLIETRSKIKRQFRNRVDLETQIIATTNLDNVFLKQVIKITEDNMSDLDFNIDEIIKKVGMSRSNFFRKIKSLTGQSPVDFINTIRFKTAGKLLLESQLNVSEVALQIGYASNKNFRNGFKKQFGVTPTEFVKKNSSALFNQNQEGLQ